MGFFILAALGEFSRRSSGEGGGIFFFLVALFIFLRIRATEIAVTNKRFIYKRGVLFRKIDEFGIKQIEGVSVAQGPFARLFNYGTVNVRGTGVGHVRVKSVEDPFGLRSALTQTRLDPAT